MSWGPEKMLIRCSKESQHPAEWTPGPPVEHQENEKDTTLTAIREGSKYCSYVRSPTPSYTQTLSNPFRTLAIKWEVYICKEVFLCVSISLRRYVSSIYMYISAWIGRWQYNIYTNPLISPGMDLIVPPLSINKGGLALNNPRWLICH